MKKMKRRYLALTIDSHETCSSDELVLAVWSSIRKLYGERGASTVDLSLIRFSDKKAVLRVSHTSLDLVRAAIACVTKMGNKPVALHVQVISGTLKGLQKRFNC